MSYSAVHHQGAKQNVLASLLGCSHVPNHYIRTLKKCSVHGYSAVGEYVNLIG